MAELIWESSQREQARGIRVRGLIFEGNLNLQHLSWRGPLEFEDCVTEGDVDLSFARLEGRFSYQGRAARLEMLNLSNSVIDGGAFFSFLEATRGVFALGANISGALNLSDAELWAPTEDEKLNRASLDLYRAHIGDFFVQRAILKGGLYAVGMTVTRNVRLFGAQAWPRSALDLKQGLNAGNGIDLAGTDVGSTIYMWTSRSGPLQVHDGSIRLENVSCRNLRITADQTAISELDGCSYTALGPATGEQLLAGLDRSKPAPLSAYAQLARYADSVGEFGLKRTAMIHRQQRRTEELSTLSWTRWRHQAFRWLAGYGYAPGRALIWLLGCLAVASAVIKWQGSSLHSGQGGALSTWSQAVAFTVDNVAPFSQSIYASQWVFQPRGFAAWGAFYAFLGLKFAAWALAGLALAAVTGLARSS